MMKQLRKTAARSIALVCVGLTVLSSASESHAQAPGGRLGGGSAGATNSPYQQRLSPYLDLLRSDNSILSPYHSFVQPRQQFRQNQTRQFQQLQKLQRAFERSATGASAPSERTQTGRGGTFNNYLHYYQFNSASRR
ncbi:hypothetical protein Mal15_62880 [Stieleria maiorica]|uniref:Uncharacterized protein n=1 Tax=Stieleria maiorica TaxID=2795974 RepID=A0A5B9MLN2_9BACT|nr:hypothetical protein [Stieleria maiorica]QEG02203.1 hypothetical protein Mal15_62880 [Stieleria maiorica]